ncbi:MAG: hypothetical protein H7308_19710 [Chthonomonadaceae bacterium]|nr:hypothetical protein [Chthonomonadaceae bacterium]
MLSRHKGAGVRPKATAKEGQWRIYRHTETKNVCMIALTRQIQSFAIRFPYPESIRVLSTKC